MIESRRLSRLLLTALLLPPTLHATDIFVASYAIAAEASAGFGNECRDLRSIPDGLGSVTASVNCKIGLYTTGRASSTAYTYGLSGSGDLDYPSNGPYDFNAGVGVSGSITEKLTVENGPVGEQTGFIGVPIVVDLVGNGLADGTDVSVTLSSISETGYGGIFGGGSNPFGSFYPGTNDILIAPFTYEQPFTFSVRADSGGSEGGNSVGGAGYSFSLTGKPIIFSALPQGLYVGNNIVEVYPGAANMPFARLIQPPSGVEDFVDQTTPAPEPATMLLSALGIALIALRTRKAKAVASPD